MEKKLSEIDSRLKKIAVKIEKLQIAEYIDLLNNPKRFLFINFMSGIARGFGMAVGFILLGALMVFILRRMAVINIPVLGEYITEIVKIVLERL